MVMIGTPMAARISFMSGTCSLNSSGIGFLVPLYSAYILWRKVGSFKSKATAR